MAERSHEEAALSIGVEWWRANADGGISALLDVTRTDVDEIEIRWAPTDGTSSPSLYLSVAAAEALEGLLRRFRREPFTAGETT